MPEQPAGVTVHSDGFSRNFPTANRTRMEPNTGSLFVERVADGATEEVAIFAHHKWDSVENHPNADDVEAVAAVVADVLEKERNVVAGDVVATAFARLLVERGVRMGTR